MTKEEDFTSFERLEVTRIEYEKFEQKLTKLREFMTGVKNKNVIIYICRWNISKLLTQKIKPFIFYYSERHR